MILSILQRYIAKFVILATLLSSLVIGSVLFVLSLMTEMKNIGEGDYGLYEVFIYTLFVFPNYLYQFSPLLILLGAIIGLSLVSLSRELSVMRTSGLSHGKIIMSVLSAQCLIIFFFSLIGEWAGPYLNYHAEIRKENAKTAGQAVVTAEGVWLHIDNNFIHIEQVVGQDLLKGVTRYQFDEAHHLLAAYYAKIMTHENKSWRMREVAKTEFLENKTKSENLNELLFDIRLNPNLLNLTGLDSHQMSLLKLNKFARELERNHQQAREYRYEFWVRVLQPLISLLLILIAIPFVLSTFQTTMLSVRILAGIMLGFALFILNAFFGQVAVVYQFPPFLAASFPVLILFTLALFLTFMVKK